MTPIVNQVNNTVLSLAHPVAVGVAGELLGARRTGFGSEGQNSIDNTLTVGFCSNRLDFL